MKILKILIQYLKERLENLNINYTNISDISFLEKNKNIKILDLKNCRNIEDFTPLSKIERLENLDISGKKFLIFHS